MKPCGVGGGGGWNDVGCGGSPGKNARFVIRFDYLISQTGVVFRRPQEINVPLQRLTRVDTGRLILLDHLSGVVREMSFLYGPGAYVFAVEALLGSAD